MSNPVAIVRKYTISGIDNFYVELLEKLAEGTELHAHPPEQRWYMVNKDGYVKPLSEEGIKSLYTSWMLTGNDPVAFARAIERAHGIGE